MVKDYSGRGGVSQPEIIPEELCPSFIGLISNPKIYLIYWFH
jgi:hypothetical protein